MNGLEISFAAPDLLKIRITITSISGDGTSQQKNGTYAILSKSGEMKILDRETSNEIEDDHITLVINHVTRDEIMLIAYQGNYQAYDVFISVLIIHQTQYFERYPDRWIVNDD